jgi:TetR/AcrR family transcriptional regulator, mexJK operon transcriptional repressor
MPKVRRGGRPSREASERLGELFLADGFGATTIEAVAQRIRISKRTFYHRFPDKEALFAAVVHRIVERLRPAASVPLIEAANLRSVLEHLATLILRAAISPQAIALHRLIVAESARFPALAGVLAREGSTEEAVRLIAGVLEREKMAGRIKLDDAPFAARQFLQMTIVHPQRRTMGLGPPMSRKELAEWPGKVTDLFINGCRPVSRKR